MNCENHTRETTQQISDPVEELEEPEHEDVLTSDSEAEEIEYDADADADVLDYDWTWINEDKIQSLI